MQYNEQNKKTVYKIDASEFQNVINDNENKIIKLWNFKSLFKLEKKPFGHIN